ncbi:MAG TPA: rhamnulokinase family protein [Solirubrobacteraceae bacterium]|nr:rhamnulokinase family protein [Solirubrobacteraceae bacterium]
MSDFAAIDLGAESGRVVHGRFDGRRVTLEVAHRFENRPARLPDGLHWNLLALFGEALAGLRKLDVRGVAVDTWGVDYALLDREGRVLGLPFHYRDGRTEGMVARAHARVGADELYGVTGIQTMPINTVFQLLADAAAPRAERIALVPDLLAFWLSGELVNEVTNASTTGLLDARSGTWARGLIERLGLPAEPFAGDPVEPGGTLGPVLAHHEIAADVHVAASHDTASAFVAAPVRGSGAAILSSGTWSLLGLELDAPVLTDQAREFNLTNERGVDGTIRLLRNVMGLWLVQECRRCWGDPSYDELMEEAAAARPDVPLFDPDDERFLRSGDMPSLITAACTEAGGPAPEGRGEIIRSALTSLACKYRLVLDRLEQVSGREVDVVHVIGGGARNELLCRLTADQLGRPVLAGPVEATALGNVLVQARAVGELGSLAEMRDVTAASVEPVVYEPSGEAVA